MPSKSAPSCKRKADRWHSPPLTQVIYHLVSPLPMVISQHLLEEVVLDQLEQYTVSYQENITTNSPLILSVVVVHSVSCTTPHCSVVLHLVDKVRHQMQYY